MQTTYIKLAGVMLLGALDESGNYYVAVPALEKALEWREDSGREKLASKSLKDFAGKGLTVGKKKADHGGTLKLLSTKDLGIRDLSGSTYP